MGGRRPSPREHLSSADGGVAMESPTPFDQPVAPPGWYRDATGQLTWWDGSRWVESEAHQPDTTWALFSHLSWFVLPVLCPLLVRIVRGKRDPFSRHHSIEALNAHLTFLVLSLALTASVWLTGANAGPGATGWLWLEFLSWGFAALVWTALSIAGAVHASHGTWWRYPFSIRFVPGAAKTPPAGRSDTSVPPAPIRSDGPPADASPVGHELPTPAANSGSKRLTFILLGV